MGGMGGTGGGMGGGMFYFLEQCFTINNELWEEAQGSAAQQQLQRRQLKEMTEEKAS